MPQKLTRPRRILLSWRWVRYALIEAMRLSGSFGGFLKSLLRARYRNSIVSYENRKHFLTDWAEYAPVTVSDVTEQIGNGKVKGILKTMNLKEDGTPLLAGIASHQRKIKYIPHENISGTVVGRLKTGDYAGIYSAMPGLDVSHVGIIIKDGNRVSIRHASSDRRYRKVIDQDFQAPSQIPELPSSSRLNRRSQGLQCRFRLFVKIAVLKGLWLYQN